MKSGKLTRQYIPKFKFQVIIKVLQGEKTMGRIAKAYGVHPENEFMEKGPEVFGKKVRSGITKRDSVNWSN